MDVCNVVNLPGTSSGAMDNRCKMFQGLSDLVTPSINKVVEFAKRIPGESLFIR